MKPERTSSGFVFVEAVQGLMYASVRGVRTRTHCGSAVSRPANAVPTPLRASLHCRRRLFRKCREFAEKSVKRSGVYLTLIRLFVIIMYCGEIWYC